MAVIVLHAVDGIIAFREEFVVVEVAGVARNAEIVAAIFRAKHLFARDKRFIEFLAVASTDDFHLGLSVLGIHLGINLLEGFCKYVESCGRRLLNEEVTVVAMLKGIHDKIDSVIKCHHEPGHVKIRDGDRLTFHHLLYPKRNNGTTASHYISITGAANGGFCIRTQSASLSNGDLFHHRFGDTHGIDRVGCFVRREDDDIFNSVSDGGEKYIIGAFYIRAYSLHRIEFARGHLLQRSRRENIIYSVHREVYSLAVTYISDIEFDFV